MPRAKCPTCNATVYLSEKNRDEGAEVYCSEACSRSKQQCPTHSPLPWHIVPASGGEDGHGCLVVATPDGDEFVVGEFVSANREGDATLFRAAPRMLAALKGIIALTDELNTFNVRDEDLYRAWAQRNFAAYTEVRAAVTEAEGRAP